METSNHSQTARSDGQAPSPPPVLRDGQSATKFLIRNLGPVVVGFGIVGVGMCTLYKKLNHLSDRDFMQSSGMVFELISYAIFFAGLCVFLPISIYLREKQAGSHPRPSAPFQIIVGIALSIFALISISVWKQFLTGK